MKCLFFSFNRFLSVKFFFLKQKSILISIFNKINERLIPVSRRVFPALVDREDLFDRTIVEKVIQYNKFGEAINMNATTVSAIYGPDTDNKKVKAFAVINNPYHESGIFQYRFKDAVRYIKEGYADHVFYEFITINGYCIPVRILPAKCLEEDEDVKNLRKKALEKLGNVEYKYCLIIKDHFIHATAIVMEDDTLRLINRANLADVSIKVFDTEDDAKNAVENIMKEVNDTNDQFFTFKTPGRITATDIIRRGIYINTGRNNKKNINISDFIKVAQIPIFKKDGEK